MEKAFWVRKVERVVMAFLDEETARKWMLEVLDWQSQLL